jgi:type II secretory pathway pseudopilin PulG
VVRRVHLRRRSGFTVLEALIALVIIGFAVVSTVEALGGGLRAESQVSRNLEAVALAETRINELGLVGRDSLAYYAAGRDGVFAPPFDSYRWRAAMEPVSGSQTLVRADVTVSWQGGSYSLETLFHRPAALIQQ